MKKILVLLLAVLLIVFTGCKNTFGTSTDTAEYTAAIAKKAYQNGSQPVTVSSTPSVSVTGDEGTCTITFSKAYDRSSITATNGAVKVYNYAQTATAAVPAGTLGTVKALTIEYDNATTVTARFDATGDTTANGYLVYLDATVITFLNGAYRLNGNGNQIGGEENDSYLSNGATTNRALVYSASYAATANASISADGTTTVFNVGSTGMVISGPLAYMPNGIDAIQVQAFDYASATWKTVNSINEVVTITTATPNTYYVVARNLPAAKEKDLYRVYIPQPADITYAVPGEGPGTGTAVGTWAQGFVSSPSVSPTIGGKTAYVALTDIVGTKLAFSVVEYEVGSAFLKVSINAAGEIEYGAIKAVQDEILAGYENGKIKLFSPSGNAKNIAYQLDTSGTLVKVSLTESYGLYRITNLVYGTDGAVSGTPDLYVENNFTLSSKGLLTGTGYEAALHPFVTPDPSTKPFLMNWTKANNITP